MRRLIINADDFGIHPAVNEAVRHAFEDGILTSTSLMAGGDAFDDAVSMARDMKGIGIGVHLTLVGGLHTVLPASEVPTLTWEDGLLSRNYVELIKRDLQGKIRVEDVYNEWDAQIKKVLATGLPVTHIDGHQHLHMWPRFFPKALTLACKYHIPCMRVPDEPMTFGMSEGHVARCLARDGLSFLSRRNRPKISLVHMVCNDAFYGMLYGGHMNETTFLHILKCLKPGVTEIMCHPSADEQAMENQFHWGYHGEGELAALLSPVVREKLDEDNVELVSYADII